MISENAIQNCWGQAGAQGWKLYDGGSLANGWHAVFTGQWIDLDVYLDVDGDWVYLQAPILRREALSACKGPLNDYLLRLNNRIFWGKFTLCPGEEVEKGERSADWVALVFEWPAEAFDAGMFRLMTEAVVNYATQYDREIQTIATDPDVAKTLQNIRWI